MDYDNYKNNNRIELHNLFSNNDPSLSVKLASAEQKVNEFASEILKNASRGIDVFQNKSILKSFISEHENYTNLVLADKTKKIQDIVRNDYSENVDPNSIKAKVIKELNLIDFKNKEINVPGIKEALGIVDKELKKIDYIQNLLTKGEDNVYRKVEAIHIKTLDPEKIFREGLRFNLETGKVTMPNIGNAVEVGETLRVEVGGAVVEREVAEVEFLTEEEFQDFKSAFIEHYNSTRVFQPEKNEDITDAHKPKASPSNQKNALEEKEVKPDAPNVKQEKIPIGVNLSATRKSPAQLDKERNEKLKEEKDLKQEIIEKEVSKHELLINEINKNVLEEDRTDPSPPAT